MAYCLLGMRAVSLPSPMVPDWLMLEMGPRRSSVRCTKLGELPELKVMSRVGSLMNCTPIFHSWLPRVRVKSSRNWNLCCSVVWGVFAFCPVTTPFGKLSEGFVELAEMWFLKYEYWNTNSLSRPLPSTEFRFMFAEWNLFVFSPQFSTGKRLPAP